jgi:heme o synthase
MPFGSNAGSIRPTPSKAPIKIARTTPGLEQIAMSTTAQLLAFRRGRLGLLLADYAELTKLRVTTLIVMTAWCGFFFAAQKSGVSPLSWQLVHALVGIAVASSGTAALNEVMEREVDGFMRRTAQRPLPAGRMSLLHATLVALLLTLGGPLYLSAFANPLTGLLTFVTAVVYLALYTPLKRVSPSCTFVGAFPGAMPGVLGWTAARNRLDWSALVLFAILFLWQFPHFFSIAWLYREDYEKGGIRMLPVVESDGRSTSVRILVYSLLLIPVTLLPSFLGMAGRIYLLGALALSVGLLYFGVRLVNLNLPIAHAMSKSRARQLLQATVIYLPLLFALMMANSVQTGTMPASW